MNATPRKTALAATAAAVVAAAPTAAAAQARVPLAEVAAEVGIAFRHETGARGDKHLPETMGAGAAWLDYDGDGWLDLYLVQSGPFPPVAGAAAPDALFRNRGDGRFEPVAAAPLARHGYGQGVLAADLDGDGDQDLYLTNFGGDRLLANDGAGGFVDLTADAGLGAEGWSSSAAAADSDGDGDLDLYVSRYVEYDPVAPLFCGDPATGERKYCDPSMFAGLTDLFYRNAGGLRFVETSGSAGLGNAAGRGLGVLFSDLDGDRAPELYVANDLTLNLLYENGGDGSFRDVSLLSGTAVNADGKPEAGMGVALADVDGDLDPDLAVTNFDVETNTLYVNHGDLFFTDQSAPSGFGVPSFNSLAFGLVAADLDLDGAIDYYVANGHIFERPARENIRYRQPDQILAGDGGGRFTEVDRELLAARATVARGLAGADFDNDGDLDLAVQENGGPAALLRNELAEGAWLGVRLIGAGANSEAVGSEVRLSGDGGRQVRWVIAGDSYQSSSDRRLLFALRPATAALEVTWPDGRRSRYHEPPRQRYLILAEGAGGR